MPDAVRKRNLWITRASDTMGGSAQDAWIAAEARFAPKNEPFWHFVLFATDVHPIAGRPRSIRPSSASPVARTDAGITRTSRQAIHATEGALLQVAVIAFDQTSA